MHRHSACGRSLVIWRPRPGTIRVLAAAVAIALFAGLRSAAALDSARSISQYTHDKWNTEQSLPQNTVYSIVQTRDGYLWLGTWEGVSRFDGARFVTIDSGNTPALGSNIIQVLMEDHSGDLWIGTRGGGLTHRRSGRFETLTTRDGLPSNFVNALVEDRHHDIWIGTEQGLSRLSNGHLTTFWAADGSPSDSYIHAIVEGHAGVIWIGTASSGLFSFDSGRF